MAEALRVSETLHPKELDPKALAILQKKLLPARGMRLEPLEAPEGIVTRADNPDSAESDLRLGQKMYREVEPFLFDFRAGRLVDEINERISQLLEILDACLLQKGTQFARIGGAELFPQVQRSLSYVFRIIAIHKESLAKLHGGKVSQLFFDAPPETTQQLIESLALAFFEEIENLLTLGVRRKTASGEAESTRPLSPREAAFWVSRLSVKMTRQGCAQLGIELEPISLEEVLNYKKEKKERLKPKTKKSSSGSPQQLRRGDIDIEILHGREAIDRLNEEYRRHRIEFGSDHLSAAARVKAGIARRKRERLEKEKQRERLQKEKEVAKNKS